MLERWFDLRARGTTVGTEVLAGTTTFMVMAYIITGFREAVMDAIPWDRGGLCHPHLHQADPGQGPRGARDDVGDGHRLRHLLRAALAAHGVRVLGEAMQPQMNADVFLSEACLFFQTFGGSPEWCGIAELPGTSRGLVLTLS